MKKWNILSMDGNYFYVSTLQRKCWQNEYLFRRLNRNQNSVVNQFVVQENQLQRENQMTSET
jgi:hypothetical protein